MRVQGYWDVYKWTILKRTSPEVECLHLTSSRRELCTSSISKVIYHKFSHGAVSHTLNGENANVMLALCITYNISLISSMCRSSTGWIQQIFNLGIFVKSIFNTRRKCRSQKKHLTGYGNRALDKREYLKIIFHISH